MANTTWSTTDKTASVALTNGNLTATVASATLQGVRSVDRQTTGKWYWEYTWNGAPGNICCGVANPNAVLSTLGSSVASCLNAATIQGNGVTISNGVQTVSMGAQANNGVVCVALDLTSQLLWWRVGAAGQWNASATANPATSVGGISVSYLGGGLPAHALMNTGTVTSQGVTANFGDTAFTGAVPAGFTSGFTKDPTVLLVHADGANGSTTFTDVSPSGHPLTSLGGAQAPAINTTNPKFGTGSAAFTGSNGNIQISNTPAGDFNFGAGQFTVEAWAYFTSTPTGTQIVLGNFNVAPNLGWDFGFNSGQLAFYYSTTGSDNPNVGGAYSPTLNTWIHLAADRDVSNVLRVYANGAVIASATVSATFFASISLYLIGNDNTNIRGFPGNLDEVRITKSLARYAGAFTPPTAPFTTLDTNMLTTQAAVEEWASGAPAMQLTQAVIEEWGSVTTYSPYTTWSTTDTTAGITLSNSDLTVATSTINQGVRSKDRQITGKFYWEATGTTWPANVDIGIANASAVLSTAGAAGQNCIYLGNTGAIWVNNVNSGSTLGARASGDIIGIALDLTNQLIWFRVAPSGNWNGSATANPATGVGGLSTSVLGGPAFPIHALFCQTTASATSFTANFGAAAFSGTVPSGFTSGFPSSAVIPVNTLATQLALDHWAAPAAPAAQLTNISIEQWAQVATVNPQAVLTQITLDQWATVAMAGVPSTGNGPMISIII